jgi:hypothetical protein
MHNSFYIRPLLKRMNADPLVRARRDAHRAVSRDAKAQPAADMIREKVRMIDAWLEGE